MGFLPEGLWPCGGSHNAAFGSRLHCRHSHSLPSTVGGSRAPGIYTRGFLLPISYIHCRMIGYCTEKKDSRSGTKRNRLLIDLAYYWRDTACLFIQSIYRAQTYESNANFRKHSRHKAGPSRPKGDVMKFGDLLNSYIESLGCTAKELADRSGISPAVISRYRSGERTP